MRAFVRYCYEDKGWIKERIHYHFKLVKASIGNVEPFIPRRKYSRMRDNSPRKEIWFINHVKC